MNQPSEQLFLQVEHLRRMQTDLSLQHLNTAQSANTPSEEGIDARYHNLNNNMLQREEAVKGIVKQLDLLVGDMVDQFK